MNTIRTRFIQIGNSRGLRVPKVLIEQLGLGGDVDMCVQNDQLVIKAAVRPRAGWGEEFRKMAEKQDDRPLAGHLTNEWDETEWEW